MEEAMDLEAVVQSFEAQSLSSLVSSPRSPTLSEQEVDEKVLAFLYDGRRSPSATPEPTWNDFSLDVVNAMSPASVNTIISAGTLVMDLFELLQTIADRRSLRKAEIRSIEQYWVWTGTVYHRFLILELNRRGRKAVWVRLDRHRGGGLMELAMGTSPAHDEALLKADKGSLIRGAVQENKQTFVTTPTLGELKPLLEAITEEMKFYTVWPENCYFFCSLIQQHLGEMHDGTFVLGELYRPVMAQDVRDRVSERVRAICQRLIRPSLKVLFQNLDPGRTWPHAQEFLKISSELDRSDPFDLRTLGQSAQRLCQLIIRVTSFLVRSYDRNFALSVHRAIHQYLNKLPHWRDIRAAAVPTNICQHYYAFLHSYSLLLTEPADPTTLSGSGNAKQDASIRDELFVEFPTALDYHKVTLHQFPSLQGDAEHRLESVRFAELFSDDAIESWIRQSSSLKLYATSLGQAGQWNEACTVYGLLVDLQRLMFRTHAPQHRKLLCHSLHQYSISLREAGRFSEACDAGAEDVELTRMLCARDADQRRPHLFASLHQYGISLRQAGRFGEACDVGAEDVALKRMLPAMSPEAHDSLLLESLNHYRKCLESAGRSGEVFGVSVEVNRVRYATDPDRYRSNLARSLRDHAVELGRVGRYVEACDASAEDVELMRIMYARDAEEHRRNLSASVQHYGVFLCQAGRFSEACDAGAEDVELKRVLYASDAEQHPLNLAVSLHHYGVSLRKAGRFSEACAVGAEDVELKRVLYARDAERHRFSFSASLHHYGLSLRKAGRFSEACDAGAEDVELKRVLYAMDADQHQHGLSASLHQYGISLREAGRSSEACDANAEDVELKRVLYAKDANKHRWNLSASLHQYGISLREAGRINEACDAGFEAVELIRAAYAMDEDKYSDDAIVIMHQHGESLRAAGRLEEADEIEEEAEAL